MATQVEICNIALLSIGQPTIVRIDANSPQARACTACWDLAREGLLGMHPWSFAIVRTTTASDGSTPAFNYDYRHAFPTNAIKVFPPGEGRQPQDDYKIEGRYILSNSDTLYVRYIDDITDPTVFPPTFSNALAAYMAWYMVMTLVQGNTARREKEILWQDFERLLSKARMEDSGMQGFHNFTDFTLDDARYDGVDRVRDLN